MREVKVDRVCYCLVITSMFLPGARIRFMRYEGTKEESGTRLNIVKDITFDKALPVAIREARAFINTQLREYTFW